MNDYNNRIMLQVTVFPEENTLANNQLQALLYILGNTLTGTEKMPNIKHIYNYCQQYNEPLGAYIHRACEGYSLKSSIFSSSSSPNHIIHALDQSDRKNLRILLFLGNKENIENFKIDEATHNMILQLVSSVHSFIPASRHNNTPNFYQECSSVEDAILYIEALLVDACLCHYFGVSDAASHHDDKQNISNEKVLFLVDIVKEKWFETAFTKATQNYILNAIRCINNQTPYISFWSLFTLSKKDVEEDPIMDIDFDTIFTDYCKLWEKFQIWYYKKHDRLFSSSMALVDPVSSILFRNTYQGQISKEDFKQELKKIIQEHKKNANTSYRIGIGNRYAIIIIKHMPPDEIWRKRFSSLFPGQLYQAKWKIIHWGELEKYLLIKDFIEIVPFMIIDE